jgi:2-polyprenyl-6-methoxyphenol hydroxylase-like FAD-dependent oxidoreductase
MSLGKRAVVVGAGIGGLASALALSRLGHDVVVVERDDTPMPDDVEAAFGWDRRGAPQVRHTHGFPALIRALLRDRYPDVLQALRDAGVTEVSIMPSSVPADFPDYERHAADLQVLSCRRTTLEWVLRRCALAEDGVEVRTGVTVEGLIASHRPLDVRGVRLDDGTEVDADVVVASTGRRDAVRRWFADHGVDVAEEEHPTGTIYLSRFYRSDRPDIPTGYAGGRRAGLGFVVAGADNGTYSCTLAVDAADAELRAHLLDPDRFEAVLPLFREMEAAVRCGGTPLTPVQTMGGLVNRIRRFTAADGSPLAHGFFAIGDAHTCTNPLYGRGSSLAVLQAVLVADALAAHPDDPAAAARAYEDASRARVAPWYDMSLLADGILPGGGAPRLDLAALRKVMAAGDPELSLLVARMMSLLLTPEEVVGDPAVLQRLAEVTEAERPVDPNRPPRRHITRDDILAAGR